MKPSNRKREISFGIPCPRAPRIEGSRSGSAPCTVPTEWRVHFRPRGVSSRAVCGRDAARDVLAGTNPPPGILGRDCRVLPSLAEYAKRRSGRSESPGRVCSKALKGVPCPDPSNNSPFSKDEQRHLQQQIDRILAAVQLTQDQATVVRAEFDYLKEASTRSGRRNWGLLVVVPLDRGRSWLCLPELFQRSCGAPQPRRNC